MLTSLLAHAAVALNFPIVIALVRGTQGRQRCARHGEREREREIEINLDIEVDI